MNIFCTACGDVIGGEGCEPPVQLYYRCEGEMKQRNDAANYKGGESVPDLMLLALTLTKIAKEVQETERLLHEYHDIAEKLVKAWVSGSHWEAGEAYELMSKLNNLIKINQRKEKP